MTKDAMQKVEPRSSRFQDKLDELAKRGDIEQMKVWGQVIGAATEVIKAGGAIVKLREQQKLVDKEIEKLTAGYVNSAPLAQEREKTAQLKEKAELFREVVNEMLPTVLAELGDVSGEQRAEIMKTLLTQLPKI